MRYLTSILASVTITGTIGLILLAVMIALLGCAHQSQRSTLRVWSDRASVTVHNRGDAVLDCRVRLKVLDGASDSVLKRDVFIRVKPGVENVRSLWASSGEHFIDAWRTVTCWPAGPLSIDHVPGWP